MLAGDVGINGCKLAPNINFPESEEVDTGQMDIDSIGQAQQETLIEETNEAVMSISAQALGGTSSSTTPTVIMYVFEWEKTTSSFVSQ